MYFVVFVEYGWMEEIRMERFGWSWTDRGVSMTEMRHERRDFSGKNVCVTEAETRVHIIRGCYTVSLTYPSGRRNKNVDENDSIDSSKSTLSGTLSRRDEHE